MRIKFLFGQEHRTLFALIAGVLYIIFRVFGGLQSNVYIVLAIGFIDFPAISGVFGLRDIPVHTERQL
jgi:hypothetical protein